MTNKLKYNVNPSVRYDGPEFEEYCIKEASYLPASRDRSSCITCPLSNLCQAGFEEQIRKIQNGGNPSLTEGCAFDSERLEPRTLLADLTEEQKAFVILHVPSLKYEEKL